VAVVARVEQRAVDQAAVLGRGVRGVAAVPDRFDEPLARQRLAGFSDEPQLTAHALVRDEEPGPRRAAACAGAQAAADRDEPVLGRLRTIIRRSLPAELEPRVAEAVVVAAEQQVPLHPLGRIAVWLDAVRLYAAVEQERQRQREHARLAGAVVAAQQ